MLNLKNGPVADITQWKNANEGNGNMEGVELIRDEKKIKQMNEEWIKEQFQSKSISANAIDNDRILITRLDVTRAMKHIGRKKAASVDGMSDILFETSEWMKLRDRGYNPMLNNEAEPNNSELEYH